jgi:hypothetical protein
MIVDDAFGYWFSGLADGEACFAISRNTGKPSFQNHFRITLRDDDSLTIRRIARELPLGSIYRTCPNRTWANSRPVIHWNVHKLASCVELCSVFDRYPLRSKKARDYYLWRLSVMERDRWRREGLPFDWARIAHLAECLSNGRRYDPKLAELTL